MSDTNDKVALVTGASRGIGKAIALELGREGCVIAGTATTQAGAEGISASLAEQGIAGRGYRVDVGSSESVEELMGSLLDGPGAPAVLVNNAGITRDNLLLRMKEEEWNEVINVNLNSMFRLARACLKPMTRARWGRIINISSVVGSSGNPGQSNYCASKAGIEGFTRSLAREIGSRGITVNAVAPGFIDTDMTGNLPEKQVQEMLKQIPLQRLGRAEEVAAVVRFLASDSGAYITGETVHVNGGMYLA